MEITNTIKGIEVIAYKRIESSIACGGFQYEIGKTYKTELWKCRFHACLNPQDTFIFYSQGKNSRYFKVKLSGEITKCDFDTEVAATEMTILEEINIDEIIKNTEWWKSENILDLLYWSDGFAVVQRSDKKYNYIDKQGKLLSDEWYKWAGIFYNSLAVVQRTNGEWAKIDKNGKIVSK